MSSARTQPSKWYPVADKDSLPLREGKRVVWGEYEVALFNLGNEYLAMDNRCPHKNGPLSDGVVAGDAVFCPLHNWKLSLRTGCALSGGEGQVKTYPVKVINGKVCLALEEGRLDLEACAAMKNNNPAARGDNKDDARL